MCSVSLCTQYILEFSRCGAVYKKGALRFNPVMTLGGANPGGENCQESHPLGKPTRLEAVRSLSPAVPRVSRAWTGVMPAWLPGVVLGTTRQPSASDQGGAGSKHPELRPHSK